MQTIAVIFGGRSAEHDVSIVTAIASVIKPLELTKKYKIEPVYISQDGAWYWDQKLSNIALFSGGGISEYIKKTQPSSVQFDGGMTLTRQSGLRKFSQKIDIVFPAMHGTYGEDGALMGLLEMSGVAYVGCGVSASAVAMDKGLSKQIADNNKIPVSKYQPINKSDFENDTKLHLDQIEKSLKYPVFVKPVHLGSSIGITKASNRLELNNGLEVAFHYDSRALVEEEVPNLIEVTLPVIGNHDPVPSLLERPLTTAEDFFDFDTKYLRGGKKGGGKKLGSKGIHGYSEVPAKLEKSLYAKAEKTGIDVYKALGCEGIARVDMLIDKKSGTVYFNEVNPLPGSLYNHNWRANGVTSVELVEKLIGYALEREELKTHISTAFNTSFLKQF